MHDPMRVNSTRTRYSTHILGDKLIQVVNYACRLAGPF
jgi:hypothetical protein